MIQKLIFFNLCILGLTKFNVVIGNWTVLHQSEVIKSVAHELNCKSIILLSSHFEAINKDILLEKKLNGPLQFYTVIWDFKTLLRYSYSDAVLIAKTLVVMKGSSFNLKNLSLLSKKASLASFDWLILSTSSSEVFTLFESILIPINCRFIVSTLMENGSVTLRDFYRVSMKSNLIEDKFANWSSDKGLNSIKTDIFSRRMNLQGIQFKFAVHNMTHGINPCKSVQTDNGKQMIQCAYFDVWRDLGRVLNYTTKYIIIEDCYKNGSTGLSTPMLEMIRTGEVDSGEDGYVWSSSRLIYNQFFWPLFQSKVILVTRIPSRKFSFSSYVRPFNGNMWLALISWLFLSGLIIIFAKFFTGRYFLRNKIQMPNDNIENMFLPFSAVCYQSSSSVPKTAALRTAYLMIYLIPVLLIPSYSGSIISSLSVPSENIPFGNLDEFERDGTYKLNAINNTFFQLFLMTDEKFEALREKNLISKAMTVSYDQSFQDICKNRVTFIYEWPLLTKYSIKCNVFKFDLSLKKIFSSMAVRKNFPYLEIFNRQMQKLICSGLNMKILQKNTLKLFKHEINPFPQSFYQLKPFGLKDVMPLFAVLAVGITLSLIMLVFEKHGVKKRCKGERNIFKGFKISVASNFKKQFDVLKLNKIKFRKAREKS